MTNYDDVDRIVRAVDAEERGRVARSPVPPAGRASGTDDEVFDEVIGSNAEALASWNLRRIRTALGVSQQEISDRLKRGGYGVKLAQTQIAKIERGERPWRVNEMFAICHALGVEWDELFRGDTLSSDAHMQLLAARMKYQQARSAEDVYRNALRDALMDTREAGVAMCRAAARLGVEEEEVESFLQAEYHIRKWSEEWRRLEWERAKEGNRAAEEYAKAMMERFVAESHEEPEPGEG